MAESAIAARRHEASQQGVPDDHEPVRLVGRSWRAAKRYMDGTHRAVPPAETLQRIRPHLGRAGLTRVANITGLDRIGIPVTIAVRPNSMSIAICSGKGLSLEAALVSGAMEAIELWHAEEIELPSFHLPYEELAGGYDVVPLAYLPFIKHSIFDVRVPCHWTLGWDLMNQRQVAIPLAIIEMVRIRNRLSPIDSFQVSSNGLASGNNLLEALCAGLFEVVERDAVACHTVAWEASGRPPPVVRLETIEHPSVLELLGRLQAADVAPVLFDCTVDTGVPVYMVYVYDLAVRHFGIFRGYGAHLDPGIAMVRALTEAAQSRLIYIAGSRDDFFRHSYQRLKWADNERGVRALRDLIPTVDGRERQAESTATFHGDIGIVLGRLRQVGLEQAVVFELTRAGFPVSVVKVVVPGLEGYKFDFYAPGPRARSFAEASR